MNFEPISQFARDEIDNIENELSYIKKGVGEYKKIDVEDEDSFVETLINIRNGLIQRIFALDELAIKFLV